jgi:Zn-dependent protease with chaperone function
MRLADGLTHPGVLLVAISSILMTITVIAASSAVRQILRTRRAIGQLRRSRRGLPVRVSRIASVVGLSDRIDLIESDELLAFCYGLRSPRLLISSRLAASLDDGELEAVLRHEIVHVGGLDPLRTLVVRSLGAGLAFVPMTAGLVQAYLCRRELAADRAAVREMGDALPLASALRRTLLQRAMLDTSGLAVGGLSATDIRIDHLLGLDTSPAALVTRPSGFQLALFSALLTLAACLLLASAHAASDIRPCVPC